MRYLYFSAMRVPANHGWVVLARIGCFVLHASSASGGVLYRFASRRTYRLQMELKLPRAATVDLEWRLHMPVSKEEQREWNEALSKVMEERSG